MSRTTRQPSRRTFLRGMAGGAAIAVALPPLEALMGRAARAAGGAFPKRYIQFFWGNGVILGDDNKRWVPSDTGVDWTPSELLAPLVDLRPDILLVTGTEVKTGNPIAHLSGPAGFLTGEGLLIKGPEDETFNSPSLDQRIARAIGGETRFRSIEVGIQPGCVGLSHNGPDSVNPPETDPAKLFDRLFGGGFRAPGEEAVEDPTLALRRSVLDSVLEDAARLSKRLGANDKRRLDQHLTGIRDLEQRIEKLQGDPPQLDACSRPEAPADIPLIDGRPQMSERARVLSDLSVMALACDQTRVLSMWHSDPLSDVLYPGATAGHHQLTHDEPNPQAKVAEIIIENLGDLAYLIEALKAVPEGDGNLLEHSVLLATTDVSEGRTHQIDEFPIILAGTGCGALKTGFHYRSETNENTSHVALSLLRAMDVSAAEFGVDAGRVTDGLSAIEA